MTDDPHAYRDDLGAALARIRELEGEVADLSARGSMPPSPSPREEVDTEELRVTRLANHTLQRERDDLLVKLRVVSSQAGSAFRRRLFALTVATLAALWAGIGLLGVLWEAAHTFRGVIEIFVLVMITLLVTALALAAKTWRSWSRPELANAVRARVAIPETRAQDTDAPDSHAAVCELNDDGERRKSRA